MKCELCNIEYDKIFGSGRFCGPRCSHSFSSSLKRVEINKKISEKLKGRLRTRSFQDKNCLVCNKQFTTLKQSKKYCSRSCSSKGTNSREDVKEKHRFSRIQEIEKGNIGYGLKSEYQGIRCDSALEYSFLKKFISENPSAIVERFKGYLKTKDGKNYQPDFLIDGKVIVEVKYTAPYIGDKLSKKWKTYVSSQDAKKECLSEMKIHGYEFLWITEKDVGLSFYRKCLKEIKNAKDDPSCQHMIMHVKFAI